MIGPVGTLEQALKLPKDETMHGALLDVNIDGGRVDDVAAILAQRDVPFVFVTVMVAPICRRCFNAVVVAKPFDDEICCAKYGRWGRIERLVPLIRA